MKINKVKDKKKNKTYIRYKVHLPKKVEETEMLDKELEIKLEKRKITIVPDEKGNRI